MKEAAGEANMTVITIVLIGVVAAVGAVLIPRLMASLNIKSCCTENGGIFYNGVCYQQSACTVNVNTGRVTSCNGNGKFNPSCS